MRAESKRIVVIGVPWSAHELFPAARDARALGLRITVVDLPAMLDRLDPVLDLDRLPVERLSAGDIARALGAGAGLYVVSLTEMTLGLAAQVRELLGHAGTPAAAELGVSDKALTRRLLSKAGLTSVRFWESSLGELRALLQTVELPVIVKPRALTGSTGVQLVRSQEDIAALEAQYCRDAAVGYGRDRLIVETVIAGEEVSAEAIVVGGRLTLLALTDKLNTGPPHFFEVGHVMPSRHAPSWSARIALYLQQVVHALGIDTSPIHAELKLGPSGPELVEIHSRFGGDNIIRLLEEAFGLNAFGCYFTALHLGEAPVAPEARRCCGIGYFTTRLGRAYRPTSFDFPHPSRITEIDFNARRAPKLEVYEGVRLTYHRLGHCFTVSDRYDEVFENVSFIADRLCDDEVVVKPAGWP